MKSNYCLAQGAKILQTILPHMPGLMTDFPVSLDDRFFYFVNWFEFSFFGFMLYFESNGRRFQCPNIPQTIQQIEKVVQY